MAAQEHETTPPLSSDSIPLPSNSQGWRECTERDTDAHNLSGADVDDSLFSLFGKSSPPPPPGPEKKEVPRGKIKFDLIHEGHDFTRGPVFHSPGLYRHIERAKRMGIDVGPGGGVAIRYVPPEDQADKPQLPQSLDDRDSRKAISPRDIEEEQTPVLTDAEVQAQAGADVALEGPVAAAEAEVETKIGAKDALEAQRALPTDVQVDQLSTEATRHAKNNEEIKLPEKMEDVQLTATESGQETEAGPQATPAGKRTELLAGQLIEKTGNIIKDVGQHAGEKSDGGGHKPGVPDPKLGQEASNRIGQVPATEDGCQNLSTAGQSEKYKFKRIGKRRLKSAFPKLTPFRRMRTWAGPPPSAPSRMRESIGPNLLPPHPIFPRPGRRNHGKSAQSVGIAKNDIRNPSEVVLESIEPASNPPRGAADGATVVAGAGSVTQPGSSAQQGVTRQSSIVSTVATRKSTRKASAAASQRPGSTAPSQEANTKKKVANASVRATKALDTVAEENEGYEEAQEEKQDVPVDEPKGDENDEAKGMSAEEQEVEREPSALPAQKGKRKAPAKTAGKAPAKKKTATVKSEEAETKVPASNKAAGGKGTAKTTTRAAAKKPAPKTKKASKK